MGALCTHNNVARECRECARDLLAEGRELRRELDGRIAKMREMPESPEIATLRATNDRLRAERDEALGGYSKQVAHTDVVRAEYQRRLADAEAAVARLRAQADANAETAGKALDRLAAERRRAEWAERVAGEAMAAGLDRCDKLRAALDAICAALVGAGTPAERLAQAARYDAPLVALADATARADAAERRAADLEAERDELLRDLTRIEGALLDTDASAAGGLEAHWNAGVDAVQAAQERAGIDRVRAAVRLMRRVSDAERRAEGLREALEAIRDELPSEGRGMVTNGGAPRFAGVLPPSTLKWLRRTVADALAAAAGDGEGEGEAVKGGACPDCHGRGGGYDTGDPSGTEAIRALACGACGLVSGEGGAVKP